jgi:N-acyl-D-aspartate/D-glutamate deacylase
MLSFDNASAWELPGRGLIRTGYAADLVIFDGNNIKPSMPTVVSDLPGGARRLVQKAEGIAATVVNGAITFKDGESTGTYSGQLLKGPLANGV